MRSNIKKIYTAQYVFLFATHLFSYILFTLILNEISSQSKKERKFPGIDIKEIR